MLKLNSSGLSKRPVALSYSVVVLSVTAAVIILSLMETQLQAAAHVSLFLFAIIISTWFGGTKPGMLAIALSILAFEYFFLPPIHSLAVETAQVPRLLLFAVLASFVAWLTATEKSKAESLRRAREALRESESMFRALFESSHDVIVFLDREGNITNINPRAEQLSGYTQSELLKMNALDLVIAEDEPIVRQAIQDAFEGHPRTYEKRVKTKGGGLIWFEGLTVPRLSPDGEVYQLFVTLRDITERKRVDDELRRNERVLREAEELSHTGSWEHNLITGEIFNSEENARIFFGNDSSKGARFEDYADAVHPDDRAFVMEQHAQLLAEGGPRDVEFRVVWPDGGVHVLFGRATVVRDESGQAVRVYGTNLDITERKRAEEKLRESERKFRALFESSSDIIVFLDRAGNILDINPRAEQLTGYNRSELSKMNALDDLIIAEDQPLIRQVIQDAFEGRSRTYEERWKIKGGETIWFEGLTIPRLSPDGEVLSTYCTLRDITERKLVEEKLRQSERDLTEAQRVARLGNWKFDITANTATWSEELYRIFEVEKTEFDGTYESFLSRVHPDDRLLVLERSRRARETGGPFEVEYRIVTRAGQLKHIREIGYAVKDAAGGVVGLFGTAQDITDRKAAEKRLHDYSQLIREMAAHLVQIEEAERRKLSQELHDRIGQTLTALNVNLTIIRGQVSGDLRDKIVPRIDDSLALADEAISRIRDVIADLRPPVLDDYGLLAALHWYGKQFASRTGIAVKVQGKEISPRPDLNVETVLFRIAQEALTNIVKHAKATKVAVTVTSNEESLCLSISDDGIGFHPSEQTGSDRQRGWGLINMTERSESLGGSFRIEARPTSGTRVVVTVPR